MSPYSIPLCTIFTKWPAPLGPPHRLVVAADHQAVAVLQSPDPAGDAGVDEGDALLVRLDVAALRVAEVRVAAVDDRVARVPELQQAPECVLGRRPRGDHQPERPRRVELVAQLLERRRRSRFAVAVEGLHVVTALAQADRHVAAHPPEADHPELHQMWILATRRPRSFSDSKSP